MNLVKSKKISIKEHLQPKELEKKQEEELEEEETYSAFRNRVLQEQNGFYEERVIKQEKLQENRHTFSKCDMIFYSR